MIIDNIPEIQQLLMDQDTDVVKFTLTGVPVDHRYPEVKIFINQICQWQGLANELSEIEFNNLIPNYDTLDIELHYINKTDQDLKLVNDKIVENQCVQIRCVEINQLKLSGDDLIKISSVDYNLTDQQKIAYNAINCSWENVKTDILYNNGIWRLRLKKPIISTLLKQKILIRYVFETSHLDILSKLQQYYKES